MGTIIAHSGSSGAGWPNIAMKSGTDGSALTYSSFSSWEADLTSDTYYGDGEVAVAMCAGTFDEVGILIDSDYTFGTYDYQLSRIEIIGSGDGIITSCPNGRPVSATRGATIKPESGTWGGSSWVMNVTLGTPAGFRMKNMEFDLSTSRWGGNDMTPYAVAFQAWSGGSYIVEECEFHDQWAVGGNDVSMVMFGDPGAGTGSAIGRVYDCAFYNVMGSGASKTVSAVEIAAGTGDFGMYHCTVMNVQGVHEDASADGARGIYFHDNTGNLNKVIDSTLIGEIWCLSGTRDGNSHDSERAFAFYPSGGTSASQTSEDAQPQLSGLRGNICIDVIRDCSSIISPAEAAATGFVDRVERNRNRRVGAVGVSSSNGAGIAAGEQDGGDLAMHDGIIMATGVHVWREAGLQNAGGQVYMSGGVPSGLVDTIGGQAIGGPALRVNAYSDHVPYGIKNIYGMPRGGAMNRPVTGAINRDNPRTWSLTVRYDPYFNGTAHKPRMSAGDTHELGTDYGCAPVWNYFGKIRNNLNDFANEPVDMAQSGGMGTFYWAFDGTGGGNAAEFTNVARPPGTSCSWPIGWMWEYGSYTGAGSSSKIECTSDMTLNYETGAPLHLVHCDLVSNGVDGPFIKGDNSSPQNPANSTHGKSIIVRGCVVSGMGSSANPIALENCAVHRTVVAGITGTTSAIGMKNCLSAHNTIYNIVGNGNSTGIHQEWQQGTGEMRNPLYEQSFCFGDFNDIAGMPNPPDYSGFPSTIVNTIILGCDKSISPPDKGWGWNCTTGDHRDVHPSSLVSFGPEEVFLNPSTWYATGLFLEGASPCIDAGLPLNYSDASGIFYLYPFIDRNGRYHEGKPTTTSLNHLIRDINNRPIDNNSPRFIFSQVDIRHKPAGGVDNWDMGALESYQGPDPAYTISPFLPFIE